MKKHQLAAFEHHPKIDVSLDVHDPFLITSGALWYDWDNFPNSTIEELYCELQTLKMVDTFQKLNDYKLQRELTN